MKSYLRFLSKNKLYTVVMAVGLSVSLAFVLLLWSYVADELSYDKEMNTSCLYSCHIDYTALKYYQRTEIFGRMPQIEELCFFRYQNSRRNINADSFGIIYEGHKFEVDGIVTDPCFLTMFNLELIEGKSEGALDDPDNIVISESLADKAFPSGDAVGQVITLYGRGYAGRELTVSGVYKDIKKSTFKPADLIFRNDDELPDGAIEVDASYFLNLTKDTDIETFAAALQDEFNRDASFQSNVTLTLFKDIRGREGEWFKRSFSETYDKELIDTYMLMCLFLTILSMMNYIALTFAFARFRLKEIATRRLLGTEKSAVIGRCFMETLFLFCISTALAIVIAFTLNEPVGSILGVTLNPMTNLYEYIFLVIMVLIISVIAGVAPSISLSVERPVDIIKDEARRRDKMYLGKVFIFIEGALSIFAIAFTLAITLQTMKIMDRPKGYETDDMVHVQFRVDEKIDHFYSELLSQNYVEKIGMLEDVPVTLDYSTLDLTDEAGHTVDIYRLCCNQTCLEMLGIEILEEWSDETYSDFFVYMCRSTAEKYGHMINNHVIVDHMDGWSIPVNGVISDINIGNLKDADTDGMIWIQVHKDEQHVPVHAWENMIVKISGDEDEACSMIRSFYTEKGYGETDFKAETMNNVVREQIKEERHVQSLLMIFSIVCLILTSMAIIALSSYHTQVNTRTTAIRKVFGISRMAVFYDMVLSFVIPIFLGAAVAVPVSYLYIGRWLENYHVRIENSWLIYICSIALVLLAVILSVILQALRLMRTNPAEALKKE